MSDSEMEAHLLLAGWKIQGMVNAYMFTSPRGSRFINDYRTGLRLAWELEMEAGK
jgi:hypothetical protein